jgi:hypothetical protein
MLAFGIACPFGQYSPSQYSRNDCLRGGEASMAKHPGVYEDSASQMAAIERRCKEWSKEIKQACDFFVARAGWVWLILTISLIAAVLSTT